MFMVVLRHLPFMQGPHVVFMVCFKQRPLLRVNAILVAPSTKGNQHFLFYLFDYDFVGISILSRVFVCLSGAILAVFCRELGILGKQTEISRLFVDSLSFKERIEFVNQNTYVVVAVEIPRIAAVLEQVGDEVVVLVRLEVQKFVRTLFVVQEHKHLDIAKERELHRLLQKTLFAFAIRDLQG